MPSVAALKVGAKLLKAPAKKALAKAGKFVKGLFGKKPSKGAGKGLEGRGYKPQPGERTFEGYVNNNVPIDKETKLFTNSKSFNTNPKNDGQFKRFGTDSHAGLSPHVHQSKRNVAPDGTIHGTVGKKTNDGGVVPPNKKDVSQLYDYLKNGKYQN